MIAAAMFERIYNKSCEDMAELPDGSVHLVVTSPPYNVGKEYESRLSVENYRAFLRRVWKESWRVLADGGRMCVNIANIERNPCIPLQAFVTVDMLDIGFRMRGDIVWDKRVKGKNFSSTAWGSWRSPSNPVLREIHEYILVFSKGSFKRQMPVARTLEESRYEMTEKEFMDNTLSIWDMGGESLKRIDHPAPFPLMLPYRLIRLYSLEGDVVLDPFMGSGTTAVAAKRLNRRWVGYEVESKYVEVARDRLSQSYLF